MKSKEYIVLGVIIALIGAYLFFRSEDRAQYKLPELSEMTDESVSRIEISTSAGTLELIRTGEAWYIGAGEYPADTSQVKEMLTVLKELKLTALVSEAGIYAGYDLTEDKKISVQAWSGDRIIRDLDIGKAADTYQHTFILLQDAPQVYHAAGNFRNTFDHSTEDLRDKTALSFSKDDISEIELVSGENHLTLLLSEPPVVTPTGEDNEAEPTDADAFDPVWMVTGGLPTNGEAVQRLLSQLAFLNCSGYLEGVTKDDLDNPVSTITLKGTETYVLSLFEKMAAETECPAVSSQNDYPFALSDTSCARISETLDQIFGVETEASTPDRTDGAVPFSK